MDDKHNQNYLFSLVAPGYVIKSGTEIQQSSNLFVPGTEEPTVLSIPFESVSDDVSSNVNWGVYTAGLKYNTSYAEFKSHDLSITMVVPDRDWRNRLIESVLYEITHVKVTIPVNDKRLTYCSKAELSSVDFKDNPYINGIEINTKFTITTPFVSRIFANEPSAPDEPTQYGTLVDYYDDNSVSLPIDISKSEPSILQHTSMGSSLTVNSPTEQTLITSLFNHIVYGRAEYDDTFTGIVDTSTGVLDNGLLYSQSQTSLSDNGFYYDIWNIGSPSFKQYKRLRDPNKILGLVSVLTIL